MTYVIVTVGMTILGLIVGMIIGHFITKVNYETKY